MDQTESAAAHLGRSESNDDGATSETHRQTVQAQKVLLFEYCLKRDLETAWQPLSAPMKSGGEHDVYLDQPGRVTKATRQNRFGNTITNWSGATRSATPLEYLRRIILQNLVFGDDTRLEGVHAAPSEPFKIVTSQTFIHGYHPSLPEISSYMRNLGFKPVSRKFSNKMWTHDLENLVVVDAKEENFLKSQDGVVPIDLVITRLP